jgi:hypothetical protein
MSERIRYAWGSSSLGEFIAAASDDGLVAFEFGEQGTRMLDTLQIVALPNLRRSWLRYHPYQIGPSRAVLGDMHHEGDR